MNRKFLPLIVLVLLAVTGAFVWLKPLKILPDSELNAFYPMQERTGVAANWPEWKETKVKAETLIRKVRENPDDVKSMLALAGLYINEGRASGNHDYYDEAALHYVEKLLVKDANNFEALTLKALVQLSKHQFAEALATATKARNQNPYNAFVHGLMVDSYVELGQYDKAVENSDKMVSIRPDIRSYARVAYLREIYGDHQGAIEAMKMAADAGGQGDEQSSWTRVQLAKLYEQAGNLQYAAMHYQKTLDARPAYANAVAGMGHLSMLQQDYPQALQLYLQADTLPSEHGFGIEVAQAYLALGQKEKAMARLSAMEKELLAEVEENKKSTNPPFHTDLELANVYLVMQQYDKALTHALSEYQRRPENIELNELVGWLHFKTGNTAKAMTHMQKAMRTGYKNPILLARAGLIFTAAGKAEEGRKLLQEAAAQNAISDPELRMAAVKSAS